MPSLPIVRLPPVLRQPAMHSFCENPKYLLDLCQIIFYFVNSFESLFVNYQPRLVAYAGSLVKDHATALDMVQDTFFSFWKKYSSQDEKSAVRLLFTMTRNRCISYLKRERLLNLIDLSFLDDLEKSEKLYALDFYYDAPDSPLIRKEVEDQVEKVLDRLPDRCREVFVMSRFNGLKNREIAEKLGISQTAVEKHIRRALSAFAEEAKEQRSMAFSLVVLSFLMGSVG